MFLKVCFWAPSVSKWCMAVTTNEDSQISLSPSQAERGKEIGHVNKLPRRGFCTQKLEKLPPLQTIRLDQAAIQTVGCHDFSTLYTSEHKGRENETFGCSSVKGKSTWVCFFFNPRLNKGRSRLRTVHTFLSDSYAVCQDWIVELWLGHSQCISHIWALSHL